MLRKTTTRFELTPDKHPSMRMCFYVTHIKLIVHKLFILLKQLTKFIAIVIRTCMCSLIFRNKVCMLKLLHRVECSLPDG